MVGVTRQITVNQWRIKGEMRGHHAFPLAHVGSQDKANQYKIQEQFYAMKMDQNAVDGWAPPVPAGGAYNAPSDFLAGFKEQG